jgi:hypothetical protein
MSALLELAARVEGLTEVSNGLDVLCEIALFKPDEHWKSVRANEAGTKVIYTTVSGRQETYWAPEWTARAERPATAAALRAKAVGEGVA